MKRMYKVVIAFSDGSKVEILSDDRNKAYDILQEYRRTYWGEILSSGILPELI